VLSLFQEEHRTRNRREEEKRRRIVRREGAFEQDNWRRESEHLILGLAGKSVEVSTTIRKRMMAAVFTTHASPVRSIPFCAISSSAISATWAGTCQTPPK